MITATRVRVEKPSPMNCAAASTSAAGSGEAWVSGMAKLAAPARVAAINAVGPNPKRSITQDRTAAPAKAPRPPAAKVAPKRAGVRCSSRRAMNG